MNSQTQHRPFFILAFLFLINISSYGQGCFQNPPISITFNTSNLQCNRDSSGYIAATVTGGSGNPMTFVWSNGIVGVDSIYNLPLGTYTLVVIDSFPSTSTTNLYAQAFDGAHGWTLNVPTGVNGADPNFWVVNSNDAGGPVGSCATAGGPNRSLHITSVFNPSGGAAYDAGGLCGFLFCPETNRRAESPVFSTLGHYNVALDFNYMANGNGLLDNASVVFSGDGGITWQVLDSSIKSPICSLGGQGLWTKFTAVLPLSCENNPAVKVGLNWTNNDDGMGSDPSVAIDSVRVFAISIDSILVCIDSQTVVITNPYILTPQLSCGISQTNSIRINWLDLGLPSSGFYEYSLDSGLTWVNVGAALTATITGLTPATSYHIWVRASDSSNLSCNSSHGSIDCATENLTCSNIPPINISLNPNNALCNGDSTGCITAIVTGGSGNPLNFAWSNGAMNVDSICNLSFGNYTLVVTDTVAINLAPTNYLALYAQTFDGVHNWTLNIPTGTNGADPNFWVVNNNEAGTAAGSCGSAGGFNQTLHVTSVFNPAGGANYDAGGLCGIIFCPETNMRAESPTFSTLGQTNIEFSFNYIANGDSLTDNASVVFSTDAGITWQVLNPSIKSPICGGGQGLWTKFSAILPPSCENNPNVKVGFNWTNNDDGVGSDPSIAIDSVLVSVSGVGSTILVCVDSQSIVITNAYSLAPTISCDSVSTTEIRFSWNNLNLPAGGFYEYSLNNGTTWVNAGTAVAATATGLVANTNYNIWVRANHISTASCAPSPIGTNSCTTLNICYNNPPLSINLIPTHLLNHGDSSGCVHATITGGSGNPLNLAWSNGVMDIDSICHLSAGNYTLVVTDTFPNLIHTNIYTQAFDGTHNWTLNIPTGVNGADPNFWTVSSNEAGMPVGACGTGGGSNRSLHITSAFFPTGGSHYNAGGLCGAPSFMDCPETNARAESPIFSTIGQSNLTFSFNYIANGDSLLDNASVVFSADGGTTWQVLDASIKSPTCGGGQGLWTKFSAVLPPSCDNNANVKVGFNWTNNDDGVGTDPSVAIDSVRIFATGPGFSTLYCIDSQSITLIQPALLMLVADSIHLPSNIGATDGSIYTSVSGGTPAYQFNWSNGSTTQNLTNLGEGIYILTVTDANGGTDTIQINLMLPNSVVKVDGNSYQIALFPNPTKEYLNLQSNLPFPANTSFEIFNALGQLELTGLVETETALWKVNIHGLLDGVHIIRVNTGMGVLSKVFLVGE